MDFSIPYVAAMYVFLILALVTIQRVIELVYSHRNAAMLSSRAAMRLAARIMF